jgi:hypothetical protein
VNLSPIELEHGERYGKLTVLEKVISDKRGPKYICGCAYGKRVFEMLPMIRFPREVLNVRPPVVYHVWGAVD